MSSVSHLWSNQNEAELASFSNQIVTKRSKALPGTIATPSDTVAVKTM